VAPRPSSSPTPQAEKAEVVAAEKAAAATEAKHEEEVAAADAERGASVRQP